MKLHVSLAGLFACVAVLTFANDGWTQVSSVEQLSRRVTQLERRVAELEDRVRYLEAQIQPQSGMQNRPATGNWRDLANWRRLRVGMTMDQVATLLGQPEKVDAGMALIHWYWGYPGGGSVFFATQSNTLKGWSEPSR